MAVDLELSIVTGLHWIHINHNQELRRDFMNTTLRLGLTRSRYVTAV
jgi:hypothetical protein